MRRVILALISVLTVAMATSSPVFGASGSLEDAVDDADYANIDHVTFTNGQKTLTMKIFLVEGTGATSDAAFIMQGSKNGKKRTCSIVVSPTNPPPDVHCVQQDVFDGVTCGSITLGNPVVAKVPRSCAKSMPNKLRFKVRTAYTQACLGCEGKVMSDKAGWSGRVARG